MLSAAIAIAVVCLVLGNCTSEYSFSIVDENDITDLIPFPQRGATVTQLIPSQSQYTVRIAWMNEEGHSFTGNQFEGGQVYIALLTIRPVAGFNFVGIGENSFIHDNADEVTHPAGHDDMLDLEIRIKFRRTAAPADVPISNLELSNVVIPPARGLMPQANIADQTEYTAEIQWQTAEGFPFAGIPFAPSSVYRARITVTPRAGFTLEGLDDESFTFIDAQTTTSLYHGTIDVTFEPTAAEGVDNRVNDLNLTRNIPMPERGATAPTTNIETDQYLGTIMWYSLAGDTETVHSGTYAAFTSYRARVTLSAKAGFTFTGVNANRFSHNDVRLIENPAGGTGSLEVVLTFRRTAPNLVSQSWNAWGVSSTGDTHVKGCCWVGNESPGILVDGNTGNRWAWGWNGDITQHHTSWPEHFGNVLSNTQCGQGHPMLWDLQNINRAHVFTIDLQQIRTNIIRIGFYPQRSGGGGPLGEWEIYMSDDPIETPVFNENTLPAGVRFIGRDRIIFPAGFENNAEIPLQFHYTDLTRFLDGEPATGRYLHIRMTARHPRTVSGLNIQIAELGLQVHQ